jgi:hypothetical protein
MNKKSFEEKIAECRGPKEMLEASRRGLMYPFYFDWCRKHGINPESHRLFFSLLQQHSVVPLRKVRKEQGVFIEGICLKEEVLNRDNLYGGSLLNEVKLDDKDDKDGFPNLVIGRIEKKNIDKVKINTKLYDDYMSALRKTSKYKKTINTKVFKTLFSKFVSILQKDLKKRFVTTRRVVIKRIRNRKVLK